MPLPPLRQLARYVLSGQVFLGILEDPPGRADLDEKPRASALADVDREERGRVSHTHGLLHVVRDDRHAVVGL